MADRHRPRCPECNWEGRYIEQLSATCWMIGGKCEQCGYNEPDEPKEIWRRFEGHGTGSITDKELRIALKQVRAALPYLRDRCDRYPLALSDAILTEQRLEQYAQARGMKVAS